MSDNRYSTWTRRLHWLIALGVIAALLLIENKGWFTRGSALREGIKWGHMQFGIAVLLLMVPRVLTRFRTTTPPITPPLPRWQKAPGKLLHFALYLLLFAVPLLGIAMMACSGKPWDFLGLPLPSVPSPDQLWARNLEDVHETAGNVLMWLAVAHAAAGVFHHLLRHDDTLRRMLPLWRKRI